MKWKIPPENKIYEALGTIADGRIEMSGNTARVFSSSRNKFYTIIYDPTKNAIMSNDNSSFWQGYLGYPAIAFLFKIGVLEYKEEYGEGLKNIHWKDINTKFKNDFDKTDAYCDQLLEKEGIDIKIFHNYVRSTIDKIAGLNLILLGKKVKPPVGY